jgi:predicted acylesterase/phospholipase RssA
MSMSYPFLFTPVVLHREGKPVYVVNGGLLSNFPIWLFDSPTQLVRQDAGAARGRRGRPSIVNLPGGLEQVRGFA